MVFSFFKMLKAMTAGNLEQHVGRQGVDRLLFYGAKQTESILFELLFESEQARDTYEVKLSYGLPDRLFISGEKITFHQKGEELPLEYFLQNGGAESGLQKDKSQTSNIR